MTDSKMEALARQLVACPKFRPMPGMCGLNGWRILFVNGDDIEWGDGSKPPSEWLPDLRDAATLGCLLQLVREAWGRRVWAMQIGGHWRAGDSLGWVGETCDSEAEALVVALLAANKIEAQP